MIYFNSVSLAFNKISVFLKWKTNRFVIKCPDNLSCCVGTKSDAALLSDRDFNLTHVMDK